MAGTYSKPFELPESEEEEDKGLLDDLFERSRQGTEARSRGVLVDPNATDFISVGDKSFDDLFKSDPLPQDELEEVPFNEQCVLLENFVPLVRNNFDALYDNFISLHGSSPSLTNTLKSRRNIQPFWDITPEQLGHLQPTVRIFKVRYDKDGNETDAVEMPFSEHIDTRDLENITNSKLSRGSGVGLVKFDWNLRGSNPAEATNVIDCSLTFRFESLQDLEAPRRTLSKDGSPTNVSFIDFFAQLEETRKGEVNRAEFNPNYFTFRIIAGWADLAGAHNSRELRELNKVLKEDQRVFTLTMTRHNFKFTQEGPVEVTIEANARFDVVSYLKQSDIYRPFRANLDTELKKLDPKRNRISELERCFSETKRKTYEERVEEEKEELEQLLSRVKLEKVKMWSLFFKEAIDKDRVYSIIIPKKQVIGNYDRSYYKALIESGDQNNEVIQRQIRAQLRSQGAQSSDILINKYKGTIWSKVVIDGAKPIDELRESINKAQEAERLSRIDGEQYTIPFIYLGDIIDTALKSIDSKSNKFMTDLNKTLLGDITLFDPRVDKRYSVNLADIPISIDLFQSWFLDRAFGSSKGDTWPVKVFIKDLIETLVSPALNPDGCFVEVPQRSIKMSTTHFSANAINGKDPLTSGMAGRIYLDVVKELPRPKNPHGENIAEYWVIYAAETFPPGKITSIDQDWQSGIYHFMIGRDRGLVKEINFQRADMPFMREARIIAPGDTQYDQLREFYTATIDMEGNNLFIPGDAIFINPSTIVLGNSRSPNSLGQIMGLVGYYRVVEVKNFIQAGVYKTILSAVWEQAGDGMSRSVSNIVSDQRKCGGTPDLNSPEAEVNIRKVFDATEVVVLAPSPASLGATFKPISREAKQERARSGGYVPR